MNFKWVLLILVLFLINIESNIVSAQECLEINLPKSDFLLGEMLQVEIKVSNSLEEITRNDLEFYSKTLNRVIEFPVKITKISPQLFYASSSTENIKEGEYTLKIKTICENNGELNGVEASIDLELNQDKIGNSYLRLENELLSDTETMSLSLIALKDYSSFAKEELVNHLLENSHNDGECWPSGGCRVKDTAISLIALNEVENVNDLKIKNWLLNSQNNLNIGNWDLVISTNSEGTCQLKKNEEILQINLTEGTNVEELEFGDEAMYTLNLSCSNEIVSSKAINTYLGRINEFNLEDRGTYQFKELSNEKCWGLTTKSSCDYESSVYAFYSLKESEVTTQGVDWLVSNKDDSRTLDNVFINLINEDNSEWLLNNQALEGYWQDLALGLEGEVDNMLTILALYSLKDNLDNEIKISSFNRGKKWLEDKLNSFNKKDLAASLGFIFEPNEIKEIIFIDPVVIKGNYNDTKEIFLQNKGTKIVNLTIKSPNYQEEISLEKEEFLKIPIILDKKEDFFVEVSYSLLQNIPVFVSGFEEENKEELKLPTIEFEGETEISVLVNQTISETLSIKNTHSKDIDVILLLSNELYGVVKVEPTSLVIPANGTAEVNVILNEGKNIAPGEYNGELKAKGIISASIPIKVIVLSSKEQIEETCLSRGFFCCESITDESIVEPNLDNTCGEGFVCANLCASLEEVEDRKVQPIAFIILAVIVVSIIVLILLRARSKTKKKKGLKDIVSDIEGKYNKPLDKK